MTTRREPRIRFECGDQVVASPPVVMIIEMRTARIDEIIKLLSQTRLPSCRDMIRHELESGVVGDAAAGSRRL